MVYYGGILIADSDLSHHGILGQKWGRRNGPPYPLGSSAHSSAEKKAGWQKSLKGNRPSGGSLSRRRKKLDKYRDNVLKPLENDKKYQELDKKTHDLTKKLESLTLERKTKKINKKEQAEIDRLTKELKTTNEEREKMFKEASGGLLGPSKKELKKQAKIDKKTRETLAEMKKNDPEKYKQLKDNTIRKGTAKEINYFVNDMTNDEIQYAITRLDKKAQLSKLSSNDVKDIWSKLDDTTTKMKTIADFTQQAANIYSNLNRMTPKQSNQNNQNNQSQKQASAGLFDKKTKIAKKLQNEDGSLTKKGDKVYSKLKEIDKRSEDISKQKDEAIKKEMDYVKKAYKKMPGEDYKERVKELYVHDPKFRDIEDSVTKLQEAQRKVNKEYVDELGKISKKRYGLLTNVGYDRADKIYKDYKASKKK